MVSKLRYQRIFELLQQRIADGTYPVGSTLPTEQELCAEFDVSRYTVREALRRLTDIGLVARRQGSGSEVLSAERRNNYVQTMRSLRELYDYAAETNLEFLSTGIDVADHALSQQLGRIPGREWLRAEAIRRTRSGEPICYVQIYVHGDYRDIEPHLASLPGPLYIYLERHHGVSIVEVIQTISAAAGPAAAARALGVPEGDMMVRVERRSRGRTGARPVDLPRRPARVARLGLPQPPSAAGQRGWPGA